LVTWKKGKMVVLSSTVTNFRAIGMFTLVQWMLLLTWWANVAIFLFLPSLRWISRLASSVHLLLWLQ